MAVWGALLRCLWVLTLATGGVLGDEDDLVGTSVDFSNLRHAGCLPADFVEPDLGDCVSDTDEDDGHEIYEALSCVADRHKITSNSSARTEQKLLNLLTSSVADGAWRSKQNENIRMCSQQLDSSVLETAEQRAVYMLWCTKNLQQYQCNLDVMRRYAQTVDTADAAFTGERLAKMIGAECSDLVQDQDAFETCMKETGLDWERIIGAYVYFGKYLKLVSSGVSIEQAIDDVDEESQPHQQPLDKARQEATTTRRQLVLLENTIICEMKATGKASSIGVIDYATVRRLISEDDNSSDDKKAAELHVARICEDRGATSAQQYIQCHYDEAPLACSATESQMFVVENGAPSPGTAPLLFMLTACIHVFVTGTGFFR